MAGRSDKAQRWREQAQRLFTAMNAYFPARNDSWGDVWDPVKAGGWGPATSFAPIIHAVDLFGYDAMSCMPEGWAERTRNTYKMQLSQVKPQWCAPAGMGYNQCYYMETSLLLDEMSDATNFVGWMARFCFAPRIQNTRVRCDCRRQVSLASLGRSGQSLSDGGNCLCNSDYPGN
ncbi:MAG: hypothetical protein ABFD54_17385 [Armatimonadota bacterium]